MPVWVQPLLSARQQSCTSGWRSFTPGGLLSEWPFSTKLALSPATRWLLVCSIFFFFFKCWSLQSLLFPVGGTRGLFITLGLNRPLLNHIKGILWFHASLSDIRNCIFFSNYFFLTVAGKAHSWDCLMPRYPDHVVFSCEEPSGHPAALRLALHHSGWGP